MKTKKPLVYLWTGTGAGKTTSALGVALRSIGWGHKVVIIQFMKGWKNIGEYKIAKKLKNYQIYQFGRKQFVNMKKPAKEDVKIANEGLEFAEKILKTKKPDLLILDEINLAAAIGMVPKKKVLKLLDKASPKTTIYMTGRYAPKEFIERADFATEIKQIKHPADKRIPAKKGIEF